MNRRILLAILALTAANLFFQLYTPPKPFEAKEGGKDAVYAVSMPDGTFEHECIDRDNW